MQPWERRLNDLWLLLESCHATYMEPELFRLNTNQFLQTSRTVTFIIQKNKNTIQSFDAWYQPTIAGWASDEVMGWAKDSRNKIEKEGDLELHSTLELTLFFSYLVEQDAKVATGRTELLKAGTQRLIRLARQQLPPDVFDFSAIKIERKWVANSLPDWELLQALTYIYTTLYQMCQELAKHLGARIDSAIPDPVTLHPDREIAREVRYLKLSDLNFHYQHSKRVSIDRNFKLAEGMKGAAYALRRSMSAADDIDKIFAALSEMAASTFEHDGYHVPMLFLFDKNMKVVDHLSAHFNDRTDKYIFWRNVADRMVASKAALVVTIGEAWIRDMKHHSAADSLDKMPIVGERLFVTALSNTGEYRSASWEIMRPDKDSKPMLKEVPPDDAFSDEKIPFYFAPILRALGIPYPNYIAEVLEAFPGS